MERDTHEQHAQVHPRMCPERNSSQTRYLTLSYPFHPTDKADDAGSDTTAGVSLPAKINKKRTYYITRHLPGLMKGHLAQSSLLPLSLLSSCCCQAIVQSQVSLLLMTSMVRYNTAAAPPQHRTDCSLHVSDNVMKGTAHDTPTTTSFQ